MTPVTSKRARLAWAIGLLAAAALVWWGLAWLRAGEAPAPYRTLPVDRGGVMRSVSATGALEPVVTVDVGSTVSGPVLAVEADFNDRVRAGQTLARIDPQTFQTRVDQLAATLAQAEANASLALADWNRYERLAAEGYAAPQLMAQKRAVLETAQAAVRSAAAQLQAARVDLSRTEIRSPVDGIVVDRRVDPGQSVAASFQAPTLFLIAQDLSRLQALISVDEADIGEVREGQRVRFSVDAFPEEEFAAAVAQVRQQGVQTQGVVSYTVIVRADNPDGRLLPGMTANAEILLNERSDVVRVPNAALRFRPSDPRLAASAQAALQEAQERPNRPTAPSNALLSLDAEALSQALGLNRAQAEEARAALSQARAAAGPAPGADADPAQQRAFAQRVGQAALRRLEPLLDAAQKERLAALERAHPDAGRRAIVWLLRNGAPEPVVVRLGIADDDFNEVLSGVAPGEEAVVGDSLEPPRPQNGAAPPGMRIRGA